MWVKICGNTSTADALLAAEAGADALGFVFAHGSPRQVTPAQVAAMAEALQGYAVERIGVFTEGSAAELAEAADAARLTGVQLHGAWEPDEIAHLRERLGEHRSILRVVHFGPSLAGAVAGLASGDALADAVLVDSRTATRAGGTGVRFDWEAARRELAPVRARLKVVVAGGLSPDNVAEAVRVLRPAGVDVVSGVERAPGSKDAERVRAFVQAARAAAADVPFEATAG